ncbi:hypothetical protein D3C73_1278190 [compost metagenome]
MNARFDHHIPGLRQGDRLQPLAHPFGPGVVATHEHRHVGAKAQPQRSQRIFVQPRTPEAVQHHQHGGRVGRTAAETAARRNMLFDDDVDTFIDIRGFFEHPRCTNG